MILLFTANLALPFFLILAIAEPAAKNFDWNKMMPAVRSVLQKQFPVEEARERYDIGILLPGHIADITSDGTPEALV